ncbi:pirin family protein [Marmoricola sp. OAE513]|uniref:pirin family protein n=1 Tax=Marmoricola sp. OAE513 TaxID=2817894 RepID=UPI001DE31E95
MESLRPREVPLGGLRAMTVRRTLPQRQRTLIGAWCFVDHYGPDAVGPHGGMVVPPHPHTGLQTVSWLFSGEIEHRDSAGFKALVRPGEVNLMTAGRGISHSEYSSPGTSLLHGAQLWLALPDAHRHTAPNFEHFTPQPVNGNGWQARVFLGSLLGTRSPVRTFSPLVGAELRMRAGTTLRIPVDPGFEHGILLDTGAVTVDGKPLELNDLGYLAPRGDDIEIVAQEDSLLLVLGGEPFGEKIVMWWNFIGRDHDEVVEYREQWQSLVESGRSDRFSLPSADLMPPIPAPVLPNVRMMKRG